MTGIDGQRGGLGAAAADPESAVDLTMVWVPGGTFRMGSDEYYPEEGPVHRVTVDGFWMDRHPVTNERFGRFVAATGYVTCAERVPRPDEYPGLLPHMRYAGSLVFTPPDTPVGLQDSLAWWRFEAGADWRHPMGAASTLEGKAQHPVVHVTFDDAQAFAQWDGKDLPTEAQWEFAARGGLDGVPFAWGNEVLVDGRHQANTWQGEFPWQNLAEDGYERTSPVGSFPANGYGLYDLIGNVWEWTTDWYQPRHPDEMVKACCIPRNPRGPRVQDSIEHAAPGLAIPRKVLKGGSHLCAPDYCLRYRPAARYPEPIDTATSHVGFRCIRRAA